MDSRPVPRHLRPPAVALLRYQKEPKRLADDFVRDPLLNEGGDSETRGAGDDGPVEVGVGPRRADRLLDRGAQQVVAHRLERLGERSVIQPPQRLERAGGLAGLALPR